MNLNPLSKLDDLLLSTTKQVAYGYNALTGRTSADLYLVSDGAARALVGLSFPAQFAMFSQDSLSVGLSALMAAISVSDYLKMKPILQKEHTILQKEDNSLEKAGMQSAATALCGICITAGATVKSVYFVTHELGPLSSVALGFDCFAAKYYFTRIDHFKPRKSVVKQGLEKLKELVQQPVYVPQPVPNPV